MACDHNFPRLSPLFPALSPAGSEAVPGKAGESLFRGFPVSPPVFPAAKEVL